MVELGVNDRYTVGGLLNKRSPANRGITKLAYPHENVKEHQKIHSFSFLSGMAQLKCPTWPPIARFPVGEYLEGFLM